MNRVEVAVRRIDPPDWLHRVPPFCSKVLDKLALDNWEVSIVFCNNEFIRELNRGYRGKDEPTDVLSFSQKEGDDGFPSPEGEFAAAGDIVVSLETLKDTSAEFSVDPREEIKRLLVHGLLHLAGHAHEDNGPERPMLVLQEEILRSFSEERIF